MQAGNIIITNMLTSSGEVKKRPAIIIVVFPPFNDLLICAVSSQIRHQVKDFDELIDPQSPDYADSGLKGSSLIRLGYLATISPSHIVGALGNISDERLKKLKTKLSQYLAS